ncbi:MAG: portal protein [Podoviridae sp. ctda_1]|nr:MAG: portal protein [Podoviridae sp. ctda_1]
MQQPTEHNPALAAKLTKWPNEPTLLALKGEMDSAKPTHNEMMMKVDKWSDLLYVRGKYKPKKVNGRSSVQPKLVRRNAEWRYSPLTEPFTSNHKIFKVSPQTHTDRPAALQNELLLNHQFRTKLNRIKLVDDVVRSTVDEGTCIVQLGWDRQTKMVKEEVPTFDHYEISDPQQMEVLQNAIQMKAENPREYERNTAADLKACVDVYEEMGVPTYAEQTGTQTVDVEKVLVNKPFVKVLNLKNVIIDPSCEGDFDKAMFVIVSWEASYSELQRQKHRYKNLDKVNWEDASPVSQPEHETNTPQTFNFKDKARKKVVAYDYWGFYDINNDGQLVPIVATWIDNVLVRMEISPFADERLPFVVIPYNPVKRELYGEPDAELLEENQQISGAVMRGMVDLMGRSANSQQGIAKGLLDPLNRKRYDNGQDYEFNPQQNPATQIIEHKYPEIPQSAMLMLGMQNQEAEALTGVKSFSGGISGEALGEVAAGIRGVLDAASKREMAILRRIANGFAEIAVKIAMMNAQFLSETEVVPITNEEFVEIPREELKGQFNFSVDISTAEVDNAQAQDIAFLTQTIGPNTDPTITALLMSEIARLKRMPDLAYQLKNWRPQPDPIQEQLKQLEVEEKRAQIRKLESEIAMNEARALQARAAANQTNLNAMDQADGTTHGREMEKQQAQSEGNQAYAVTQALTKPVKEGEKAPDIEQAIGFNALTSGQNRIPSSTIARDELVQQNPAMNLRSPQFDPSQDPALNPNFNI